MDIAFQSGDDNLINSLLKHKSAEKVDSSVGYEDDLLKHKSAEKVDSSVGYEDEEIDRS